MTGSQDATGPGGRQPVTGGQQVTGRLIAAAGAVVTLASMFLPWYSVNLRISSYADLSIMAIARINSAGLVCGRQPGHGCHVSAQVGPLTGGIWDWRPLIAVGAAAVLILVLAAAMRPAERRPAPFRPARWRVLLGAAAVTAALVTAAVLVSPVSAHSQPGLPAPSLVLTSSLSYGAFAGLAGALIALAGAVLAAPPALGEGRLNWYWQAGHAGAGQAGGGQR